MNTFINQIQQYISDNQLEKALNLTSKRLVDHPENLILNKLLSHILGLQDNYLEAIKIIEKVILKYPDDFDLSNNLGYYYLQINNVKKAKKYIKRAMEINPKAPTPYQNYAEVNVMLRDFKKAEKEIEKCIKINSENFDDYHFYLNAILIKVQILIATKKTVEACNFITNYLTKSFHGELFLQLIDVDRSFVTSSLVKKCHELLKGKSFRSNLEKFQHLVPLYFALAKYYEKKDFALSDQFYVSANKEIFSIQRVNLFKFQNQQLRYMDKFDKIKNLRSENQSLGSNNIFIVGQPRSGTTLLESLITANEEVFGGGELNIMGNSVHRFLLSKENLEEADIENVGMEYENLTAEIKGEYSKIVDKMPANFSYIGYILKCLPCAKVILLLRDPWDIAISLFKQRYVTNIAYSSSFFNIGVQLANFEATILYWQKYNFVKNDILVVKYEDLVSNIENKRKEIYNFCQITSHYSEAKREGFFAKTASMNQVQKKIHQQSLQKSNFADFKSEFIDALRSQRDYWRGKNIDFTDEFFGYPLK